MLRTTESVAFRKLEETVRKSCGYFGKKESAIISVRCSHEDTSKAAGLLGQAGQPPRHKGPRSTFRRMVLIMNHHCTTGIEIPGEMSSSQTSSKGIQGGEDDTNKMRKKWAELKETRFLRKLHEQVKTHTYTQKNPSLQRSLKRHI